MRQNLIFDSLLNNDSIHYYLFDYDGNGYTSTLIGSQEWVVQNLRTTHYSNGTSIPLITTDNSAWVNDTAGAYSWYDNNMGYKDIYGALYNRYAADHAAPAGLAYFTRNGVQDAGWKVPNPSDFDTLHSFIGGDGGKLKETGTIHWQTPNTGATDIYGFKAVPAGERRADTGAFYHMGRDGYLMYAPTGGSAYRALIYNSSELGINTGPAEEGFTVRCMRDVSINYDFWYMPSHTELIYMRDELKDYGLGNFLANIYWASSESTVDSSAQARIINFDYHGIGTVNKSISTAYGVHACRTFTSSVDPSLHLRDFGTGGGRIFWIIDNGGGSYTYYEAANEDQSLAYAWSNITNAAVGPTAQGQLVGDGKGNTLAIIAQSGELTSAARLCYEYNP